eukprot:CAMPEP_0175117382 /NCGR_PEP_ID=MMETSP0086_2-20121207/18856_1 /TAXON_ID=136419 /ORGANISM="Unknown Unknown, Strain D1" /LENGTH=49 /DNA_ID= /DNA_START= /DNA_END= /DNA_ORIENTATION=
MTECGLTASAPIAFSASPNTLTILMGMRMFAAVAVAASTAAAPPMSMCM